MIKMIEAKIPGWYIFHAGEEHGLIGAHYNQDRKWPNEPDFAIAFDRKDRSSIITHQSGGQRCCSDKFAEEFALLLNESEAGAGHFNYKCDDGGLITDTAAYMRRVPECTNISVGYFKQHTSMEVQDMAHAERLLAAIIENGELWEELGVYRDPKVHDSKYSTWNGGQWNSSMGKWEKNGTKNILTEYGQIGNTRNNLGKEQGGESQATSSSPGMVPPFQADPFYDSTDEYWKDKIDSRAYELYAQRPDCRTWRQAYSMAEQEIVGHGHGLDDDKEPASDMTKECVFWCDHCKCTLRNKDNQLNMFPQFCEKCGLEMEKLDVPLIDSHDRTQETVKRLKRGDGRVKAKNNLKNGDTVEVNGVKHTLKIDPKSGL